MVRSRAWDSEQDVVVVGSGAAALAAAIAAHDRGATVRVVERCDVLGGTSAVSGGGMWIPLNHRLRDGDGDTRERVLEYVRGVSLGRADDARLTHFVDNKFWQGKLNFTMAMAQRKVKMEGNRTAALKLLPLTGPLFQAYRETLKAEGREDLLM